MTKLSDGIDALVALLQKSRKFIKLKPKEFHPIYNLYYMMIYVAIQDAFDYPKNNLTVSSRVYKTQAKYRNAKRSEQRKEALDWLRSTQCKMMWEEISDIEFNVFLESISKTHELFCKENHHLNNYRNDASQYISKRMRVLAV